jgi:hypothetical protein
MHTTPVTETCPEVLADRDAGMVAAFEMLCERMGRLEEIAEHWLRRKREKEWTKIILYSKYGNRHKRRHESHMRAQCRPSLFSSSHSSISIVKSTFSEMSSEGQLGVFQGHLVQS